MAAPMEIYDGEIKTETIPKELTDIDFSTLQDVVKETMKENSNSGIWPKMKPGLIDNIQLAHDTALNRTDWSPVVISCLCDCYRFCRNSLAANQDNQILLHRCKLMEKMVGVCSKLLTLMKDEVCDEERLTLLRCAVQFMGNYCSGNQSNQLHLWEDFHNIFRKLLEVEDSKLQDYTQLVVHLVVDGLRLDNQGIETAYTSGHWHLLSACIDVAAQTESHNGLLVVEDILKMPGSVEHVMQEISGSARIFLLEVLINMLKVLQEDVNADRGTSSDAPAVSNLQYLAADFMMKSHVIAGMGTPDAPNQSTVLFSVKELECLCVATSHHTLYSILHENDVLLRLAVSLLETIEDLRQAGSSVFANVEKMSRASDVDPHHPVFGLKRDLIRLLGNMAYRHRINQDLIRELGGIPLILNQTNIDGKNPFITQWSVFASHNLTENNEDNQRYIASLKMEGLANNSSLLDQFGLEAENVGDKVVVKKKRTR